MPSQPPDILFAFSIPALAVEANLVFYLYLWTGITVEANLGFIFVA